MNSGDWRDLGDAPCREFDDLKILPTEPLLIVAPIAEAGDHTFQS